MNSDDHPQVCSVDWASDGSFLAIGNEDGAVELWDADTGQRVRKMEGHQVCDGIIKVSPKEEL